MPVVPRRSLDTVPTAPLPGVRLSPDAPAAAFGGPAPVDIGPVTKAISGIFAEERDKADQLAVLDADKKLADTTDAILYDPNNGVLNLRGKNALEASPQATDAWTKATDQIAQGLTNDRQRMAFQRMAVSRAEDLHATVMRHAAGELQKFDAETTTAFLDNSRDAALQNFQNPDRVAQEVDKQRAAITDHAKRNGWSDEARDAAINAAVTQTHEQVINRMLANGDDLAAAKYYATVKGEVKGDATVRIEHALDVGSVRGESQHLADDITARAVDMTRALRDVAKITDPKVRDETEQRVVRFYGQQQEAVRLRREAAFEDAGNILEKTHDIHSIPPHIWSALGVEHRESLTNREYQLVNPRRVTDPDLFSNLLGQATESETSRQAFAKADLSQYRLSLSEPDYRQVLTIQRSILTHDLTTAETEARKAARKAADRAQAVQTLRDLGVDVPAAVVPGGPLTPPQPVAATPPKVSPTTPIPQAVIDRANRDPKYKAWLATKGVKLK